MNDFHGAGQHMRRPQPFVLHSDEPLVLLGRDEAPTAGEYLLSALAACVTTSLVYHAAARGIEIEQVESTVEGNIDLRGFLGIDESVRKGFENIQMILAIKANVSDEQLEELAGLGPGYSPVLDSLTRGVPVKVRTERMKTEPVSDAA
jgi:uncharacterized OsmC-like protein